jgi:hypothetical protein
MHAHSGSSMFLLLRSVDGRREKPDKVYGWIQICNETLQEARVELYATFILIFATCELLCRHEVVSQ